MALLRGFPQALITNGTLVLNTNTVAIDTADHPFVSVFGKATVTGNLKLYYSIDGTIFYLKSTTAITGGSDFAVDVTVGARYLAVQVDTTQTSGFYLFAAVKGGS